MSTLEKITEQQLHDNRMAQAMASDQKEIDQYLIDKELRSGLVMRAALAYIHLVEYAEKPVNKANLQRHVAAFYKKNRDVLLGIKADYDEICAAAKLWECKYWFGGTQQPMTDEELGQKNWEAVEKLQRNEPRIPPTAGLQKLYHDSSCGLKGVNEDFTVMMCGSAGRVLVTIQDNERHGKFNGAWITMIFDETADYPRGGVQSQCGTKEELLSLLTAASDNLPELKTDDNVCIA